MKTKNVNNKLDFRKSNIVELNEQQQDKVLGGTSWGCVGSVVTIIMATYADRIQISVVQY